MRGKYIRIYYYVLAWAALIAYLNYGGIKLALLSLVFTLASFVYHVTYMLNRNALKEPKEPE